MSSYTKYNKAYYYKKVWNKERAKFYAYVKRNDDLVIGPFIDKVFSDFNAWLEWRGIDLWLLELNTKTY